MDSFKVNIILSLKIDKTEIKIFVKYLIYLIKGK